MDWTILPTIGEAIAIGLSILGITGLGWWIAVKIVNKIAGETE